MRTTAILSLIGYGAWNQLPDYGKIVAVLCAIILLGKTIKSVATPIFWISKTFIIKPTLFLLGKARKRKGSLACLKKENEYLRQRRKEDNELFSEIRKRLGITENESLYDEMINLVNAKYEAKSLKEIVTREKRYFKILAKIRETIGVETPFDKLPEKIEMLKKEIEKTPEYKKNNYELFKELAEIIKVPAGCQIIPWSKRRIETLEEIEKKYKNSQNIDDIMKKIDLNKMLKEKPIYDYQSNKLANIEKYEYEKIIESPYGIKPNEKVLIFLDGTGSMKSFSIKNSKSIYELGIKETFELIKNIPDETEINIGKLKFGTEYYTASRKYLKKKTIYNDILKSWLGKIPPDINEFSADDVNEIIALEPDKIIIFTDGELSYKEGIEKIRKSIQERKGNKEECLFIKVLW